MRTGFGSTSRQWAFIAVFAVSLLSAFGLSVAPAQANAKYAGFVIDAKTGKTLYSENADKLRYPASLTKMMTLYMMFDAIERGKMKKSTRIKISRYAASRPPSKLGIKPGRTISAEQAIYALTTKSANDVATAVAEHLGGTEGKFAKMMTRKARALGMKRTTFKNASGLTSRGQLTTARDMARLGIALREHFPRYYRYFSTTSFKYGKRKYRNHNRLLGRVRGVDGIKTGYTRASGFNLVSSVQKGGRSIVAVVMGGRSGKRRNAHMQRLISRYLKKASRRSKKQLVASRKATQRKYAAAYVSKTPATKKLARVAVPTQAKRPASTIKPQAVQVASLASTTSKGFKQGSDFDVSAVRKRLKEIGLKKAPVPVNRPQEVASVNTDPVKTNAVRPVAYVPANLKTDNPVKQTGWQIQIGATDNIQSAIDLLNKAKKRAPGALKSAATYTETVSKNTVTLYRARFTGFSSKQSARTACKALKAKKFACMAIHNG